MKKIFGKEAVIGLCVLIALLILFFGINYLKGVNIFKPSNQYYAVFTNVNGLTASAPVTLNGVKVGQVDNVTIMENDPGKVVVAFSIDKNQNLTIPFQSNVTIVSSMLGEASLRLDLATGTSSSFTPGDTIPSKVEEGLLDKAGGVAEQLSARVDSMMVQVNDILPKVDSLMVNLNTLTASPELYQTLSNMQKLTASLNTTAALLNKSASNVDPILADLNSITTNVDSISANVVCLTNSLNNSRIDETLVNLNSISENIDSLTQQLNNPDSNIGQLLHGTELYDNLVKTTADIDALLIDIKQNPKRYISIKLL